MYNTYYKKEKYMSSIKQEVFCSLLRYMLYISGLYSNWSPNKKSKIKQNKSKKAKDFFHKSAIIYKKIS